MSALHFLRPWWFAALPVLLALLWALWHRRLRSRSWQGVCDPQLLPHLLLGRSRRRANWPLVLLLAAIFLAVTALAGPTWRQLPQPLFRQQSGLVICFDLSRSMLAGDLKPSRLMRARLKIEDILRQRREGQTALIAFAGDAFAVTPLTEDRHTIEALLATLSPQLMPAQGSEPQRALALGTEMLQRAGLTRGTLLLVTDEDRPDRVTEAAARLHSQGLVLAVLGVGTPEGAPIPLEQGGFFKDAQGGLVLPRLDEAGLVRLAAAGGGSFRRIRVDDDDFKALLAHLDHHGLDETGQPAQRLGDRWEEAGVWLLWPLALLCAAAFRRGWLAVLALALMLPPGARAASWTDLWQRPDQQAYSAFKDEQYDRAGKGFDDPRWKASALYRAGQYEAAVEALPPPQTADDWYNRANALARNGRLQEALDAYDKALSHKADDADARENRRMVKEALEQQQKKPNPASQPGENGQNRESGQPPKSGQPSGDRRSSSPQGDAGPRSAGQPQDNAQGGRDGQRPPEPVKATPSTPNPADSGNDSAEGSGAEAPDRAPTVTARPEMAKDPGSEDAPPPPAAGGEPDPPIDAEQRQMQQWLQRIPDDPGGLLRRKFLYQYRQRGQQMETDRPW